MILHEVISEILEISVSPVSCFVFLVTSLNSLVVIVVWSWYWYEKHPPGERFFVIILGSSSCDRPCNLKWDPNRFFSLCDLEKFDRWPREKIGNLFHAPKISVYHFIAIHEFKLELSSGNAQFGSQTIDFTVPVTLKFGGWSWQIIGHLFYATLSFVHNFGAICDFKLELQPRNAQFELKSSIFRSVGHRNVKDDLCATNVLQALCVI